MSEGLGNIHGLTMERFVSESTQSTVHEAMDRFLDTVVRYKCVDREARVSHCRVLHAIHDRLYQEGLMPGQLHWTGSMFEGMPREVCSDLDAMFTHNTWPVVVCEPPSDTPTHGHLIANMDQPAYVTLQVSPDTDYHSDITNAVLDVTGCTGVKCLASRRFVNNCYQGDENVQYTHGPAGTGLLNKRKPEDGMMDKVPCLISPSWPPCTSEFLTRPRPHGWPSQSLIDKIQQAGCHVVGVGHPHSDNKDIEWRWSFSVAEKELIHDMCDTMAGVMYALKAIKKKNWIKVNDDKPTTFCSYYIKTACLWVCEETDQSNTAIMDLCRQVIDWLVTCYRTHTLPHYFIRGQNLIGHLSQDMCEGVVRWLDGVREQLYEFLLNSIVMDRNIEATIEFIQSELTKSTLRATTERTNGDKYKSLISDLCCNHISMETREVTVHMIEPGSDVYVQRYRFWMGYWSDISNTFAYETIQQQIKSNIAPSTAVSLPEKLLQPLLSDLHSVVKEGCVDMYRSAIHRHLGDIYHWLYVHYRHGEGETRQAMEECHHKAVHYYTEGLEMVYPDGWSDRGLGGYVRLATFYHLSGQTDRVEETLQHLEPLLEWGRADDVINTLGPVRIYTHKVFSVLPWKQDRLLYTHLIEPRDDGDILVIHPLCLGYYIQVRWLLGVRCDQDEGGDDITSVVPVVPSITVIDKVTMILAHMEDMLECIRDNDMRISSQTLITIIQSLVRPTPV